MLFKKKKCFFFEHNMILPQGNTIPHKVTPMFQNMPTTVNVCSRILGESKLVQTFLTEVEDARSV